MGKYLIDSDIRICSYTDAPYVTFKKGKISPRKISFKEFCILIACDGKTEIDDDSDIVRKFLSHNYIRKATDKDEARDVDYREYNNRMMPYLSLEITQRCNFNCIHCFNASDLEVQKAQMSFEQVCNLLDQAKACGVFSFLITGGEPLMHPDFMKILREIYARGMSVYEINTNGFFLNREILRAMKEEGIKPDLKISFDGIGKHDLIRNHKGCEEHTINAIKMAVEEGFSVYINMNMNRLNEDSVLPSLLMLNECGVESTRIIRTTESPRWSLLGKDASMPWSEFFEKSLAICKEYAKTDSSMLVEAWQFFDMNPRSKMFGSSNIRSFNGDLNCKEALCVFGKYSMAIEATGNVIPCFQVSGAFSAVGKKLGNAFDTPLKELIDENSCYSKLACASTEDKTSLNRNCASCPYLLYCGGGCPAMGILFNHDYFGADNTSCIFFRDKWFHKIEQSLQGYKCTDTLPTIDDGGYLKEVTDVIHIDYSKLGL